MSDMKKKDCGCYEDRVNHIKCEVNNCVYHASGDACSAPCIEVTPSYASNSGETACATFRAEQK